MRKVYGFINGNELTPTELIRMLMRVNGETLQTMHPKFGHNIYQMLQKQINKNGRMRVEELYAFVKYFGGSINVEVPMQDGEIRTIEIICKDDD